MGDSTSENASMPEAKPLVTFALFAFNQERYIREAVAAAMAQTYSPLELILSDDCSTDSTFEIMAEMVSAHNSPHKITLNRNNQNMGISAHVRHVHEMSHGEIIVHAAGDDVSRPDRTEKLVDAFLAQSDRPSLIESNADLIDEAGRHIGLYLKERSILRKYAVDPVVKHTLGGGCTYAIHRSLIDRFDAPMPGIIAEDGLINIRANMLNGTLYIPDVLVKYRITNSGVWSSMQDAQLTPKQIIENETRYTKSRIMIAQQAISDATKLHRDGIKLGKETETNVVSIDKLISELQRWLTLCDSPLTTSTLSLLKATYKREYIDLERWIKVYAMRWFPAAYKLVSAANRRLN
jgi:glycosyltransferase involved in cell wall biosynthesis